MKKKSLLIIGSSGFFGTSIIDYLYKKKQLSKKIKKLILISRKNKNIKPKNFNKKFSIIEIKKDINDLKKIPYADYVIYCAINNDLEKDLSSVQKFVKIAKKYLKGSNILYTSSGAVYGNQSISIPYFKENKKINPKNHNSLIRKHYAISKIKSEREFKKLVKSDINISIARCFAFVGKRLPLSKHFVIGNFIKNILDKKDIIIKSQKKVIRSYMHADDLVFCLFKLLFDHREKFKTFNVGSEDEIDIKNIAIKLSRKYNSKVIMPSLKKNNGFDKYIPDISKFRKKYNYKKKLSSYRAILKTINQLSFSEHSK